MRVIGSANSVTARPSPAALISDVEAGGERNVDIVKVPVDQDLRGKEGLVLPLDPQKHQRKEIQPVISQEDEMTNPLRVVS